MQTLPKLALIRRCLRWAAGEFGTEGPVGEIDTTDAESACDAVAFFVGRWLLWRPALCEGLLPSAEQIGLQAAPGDDPALLDLATTAKTAQATVRLIERLVRYLRLHDGQASLADMQTAGPMATATAPELHEACSWLVDQGHAQWIGNSGIHLTPLVTKKARSRRATTEYAQTS